MRTRAILNPILTLSIRGFDITKALRVIEQRRKLARLTQHQLDDMGISRGDAMREAARPFWDLPGH